MIIIHTADLLFINNLGAHLHWPASVQPFLCLLGCFKLPTAPCGVNKGILSHSKFTAGTCQLLYCGLKPLSNSCRLRAGGCGYNGSTPPPHPLTLCPFAGLSVCSGDRQRAIVAPLPVLEDSRCFRTQSGRTCPSERKNTSEDM